MKMIDVRMNDCVYATWIDDVLSLNISVIKLTIPEFFELLHIAGASEKQLPELAATYLEMKAEGSMERMMLQGLWENNSLTYPTGIDSLDDLLGGGIHTGLTVIAAPPGRGKSTLALQLARSFSKQGYGTIYICNDMSRSELVAKMLSSASYERMKERGWTAREILSGEENLSGNRDFQNVTDLYQAETTSLFIETGKVACDVNALAQLIDSYMALFDASTQHDRPPVIILDYLQNVQVDGKGSEREQVNAVVRMLQGKIEQYRIPILAISSVSRDKYGQALRLDSLKESGLIEYATSVALALQFRAVHSENYSEKKERGKPEQHMELYVLKERFGEAEQSLPITFVPKFSTFLFKGVMHKSKTQKESPKREWI